MPKKLIYKFVKKQFEKEEYKLLTQNYEGAFQKLDYICPKGHKHSITWADWSQRYRCPYCAGYPPININFIKTQFEKEGYILLTAEYIDSQSKLFYICPNNHKYSISWNSWQQNHRCPYCDGQGKPSIEFIRSEFEKEGYKLLTDAYVNAKSKLEYVCPEGHKHNICWGNWQQGQRCLYCAGHGKPTIYFIAAEFEKEGYKLLTTEYESNKQKLDYVCKRGHRHSVCWSNWQSGKRCPYCSGIISSEEIEVRNFVKSLGVEVLPNNRNQIFNPKTGNGFELDIFMPDLNKAIEYNGTYWHKDKDRDLLKQQLCELKGINLLTIWDREWKVNNKKCEKKIMRFIF